MGYINKKWYKKLSKRMKKNNPMKNQDVAKRVSETRKKLIRVGKIKLPQLEKAQRMSALSHTKIFKFRKILVDLAYVVGVLLGDGTFSTSWKIKLTSIDKDFNQEFSRALQNISNMQSKTITILMKSPKHSTEYETYIYSKKLWNFLKKKISNLSWIKTKKQKIALIRGLWDSDGFMKKGFVDFRNQDIEILNLFNKFTNELGLQFKNYRNERCRINGKENVIKFTKLINPTIKRKRSFLGRPCGMFN